MAGRSSRAAWGERERVENVFRKGENCSNESSLEERDLEELQKLTFFSQKKKTLKPNQKTSAASVAALLVAGSALTAVSAAPQPGSDEDVQSREADYSHFAEM